MKTKKNNELKLMDLKGKAYLPVDQRVIWLKDDEPDVAIITTLIEVSKDHAVFKCDLVKEGKVVSTGHGQESYSNFPAGYFEKAETIAIGRAIAHYGFGTQYALLETTDTKIADSPVETKELRLPNMAPQYESVEALPSVTDEDKDFMLCPTGKGVGKKFAEKFGTTVRASQVNKDEIKSYMTYLENNNQLNTREDVKNWLRFAKDWV